MFALLYDGTDDSLEAEHMHVDTMRVRYMDYHKGWLHACEIDENNNTLKNHPTTIP
jgi:hypothetical protein